METSQKSIRVMHYIGEFLDLDARSFTNIAEFIALIQAIREGLSRIDPTFSVSDFHINILFLSKLQAHPKWNEWARHMLRDPRINVSDSSRSMAFHELAEMAIQHEKDMTVERTRTKQVRSTEDVPNGYHTGRLQNYTQEEINSFVIRQMRNQNEQQHAANNYQRHSKRPSQEEINEFVVRQMREEQERKTRARSKSEPRPNNAPSAAAMMAANHGTTKCDKCGERNYPGQQKCHHIKTKDTKKPPTVEVPRANFVPKKVEFVKRTADGLPTYRTGFALT
ncbi:conserved hypothetical protein [Talaromyces stipitatus ATCC 10500]|uniref:Uncharacterized protein n=1 Tax=Talaromyces stipitatus (strain ATCC 10500 / CBS 375.48 / QM 6759 / NRRL 1006) TaxID=441959 RepID=B8LU28_TALSN|nr:uncharacterized protein TSTA_072510 [Talaromyces stipitatus ATCC 10500]EED23858.1 conserved hypothetical protein [Talaromyces stipitatus ATCC 10500]